MDAEAGIGEQASKYIYRIRRDHELESIHGPAWMRVGSLHGGGPELRRIGRGWVGRCLHLLEPSVEFQDPRLSDLGRNAA